MTSSLFWSMNNPKRRCASATVLKERVSLIGAKAQDVHVLWFLRSQSCADNRASQLSLRGTIRFSRVEAELCSQWCDKLALNGVQTR